MLSHCAELKSCPAWYMCRECEQNLRRGYFSIIIHIFCYFKHLREKNIFHFTLGNIISMKYEDLLWITLHKSIWNCWNWLQLDRAPTAAGWQHYGLCVKGFNLKVLSEVISIVYKEVFFLLFNNLGPLTPHSHHEHRARDKLLRVYMQRFLGW